MPKVLNQKFFDRPTLTVAEELLGKYLVRKLGEKNIALKITEVEGYDGPKDKASHAVLHRTGEYKASKTAGNAPMFGKAGRWYVYFTYGMHWMLNIVTGPKDYPAAILIRGTQEVNGPARLTKFLGIDKTLNKKSATKKTGLWFEDREEITSRKQIKRMPRVGVAYAGPVWSKKPYRFMLETWE